MNKLAVPPDLVYCKDCQSRNSWVRNPVRDVLTESGKVYMESFKCKVCGATTLSRKEGD